MPRDKDKEYKHSNCKPYLHHHYSRVQWNSPLPYVFGGLVFIIFGLIVVALLILAYSHYKSWRDLSNNSSKEDKSTACPDTLTEIKPKIVVIMAGDYYPTYVAKPSAPSCLTQQH